MKNLAKILFLAAAIGFVAPKAQAQISVGLSVRLAPPPLPVYDQPEIPADGYLWQPGYWAYNDADGYYWVPGVWVRPPHAGLLWTPNYWGYDNGVYLYHSGYWGSHVGYYGGINYGFGYSGIGFGGGVWAGNHFRYNTAVFHVNNRIVHNTYVDRTVIHNDVHNRASFNGPGGINRQPRPEERAVMNERHIEPTHNQIAHQQVAARNPAQHFSANNGAPATAAMNKVNGRRFNQQGRVANGINAGKMNANEASHVEGREANVNREVHNDRAANGGSLTPQERQHVNNQQNNMSRTIRNDNHNANNAPQQQREQQARPQQQREQQARPQQQQREQQARPQQQREQQARPQQQQQRQQQARPQQQPREGGGGRPPEGGGGGEHHRP